MKKEVKQERKDWVPVPTVTIPINSSSDEMSDQTVQSHPVPDEDESAPADFHHVP